MFIVSGKKAVKIGGDVFKPGARLPAGRDYSALIQLGYVKEVIQRREIELNPIAKLIKVHLDTQAKAIKKQKEIEWAAKRAAAHRAEKAKAREVKQDPFYPLPGNIEGVEARPRPIKPQTKAKK
jgi:hypothetical protein